MEIDTVHPDVASRFRARMLRLSTSGFVGSLAAGLRTRRAGTWDHYTGLYDMFVPGLRRHGAGSGVARMRRRARERHHEPAESLGIDRGPVVRSRTLAAISRREWAELLDEIEDDDTDPRT